ncbi:MAG TPA: ABC transporter permease [Steroidobacteraceae bacterium]|jgi:simple sugar transport system permease protein|nr:ABC transporter permease [Steroidobacteraceae bacterium]
MNSELLIAIFTGTVVAATPLIYAALGELVVERAGVLNLGVEGMMLVGALTAFAVSVTTGSLLLGFAAAACASMLLALLFGVLTLTLQTNQVATGLALTLFGLGLSAFAGRSFAGLPSDGMPSLHLPLLSDLPYIGPLLFRFDLAVYGSLLLYFGIRWFLQRTRGGLLLRAVGESPAVAHALGEPVMRTRYLAVLFGGATSGLAGAYLSTALTPMWVEGMSAGRGWIALALVVFATWKPLRVLLGAYLFGGVTVMQLHAQGLGIEVPSEILSMLPYAATIVVLVLICRDPKTILLNQPASLGRSFHPDA